jgi:hypothetical protein
MGLAGFLLGTAIGQLAGAWLYWRVRASHELIPREFQAATVAGITTTVVASALYIPLQVHTWIGGEGTFWGASVFLALCMGICQGALLRGRPLGPRSPTTTPTE